MFSRIKNFLTRHKQKFIIGGIFVGGAFLLSNYVEKLVREWQERETKELLERARKQQHYESIERTCNQTALTMAPNLRDTISKLLKTDDYINQLKLGASNKVVIWEKLKILAFTKISTLVYASSLLIVTLRIQLNLIGGYMFQDTARESKEIKITSGVQEKYLGLCQFFMEEGAKKLCALIEENVYLVLEDKSLKEKLTIQDIEQIFWAIQSSISNKAQNPCKSLADYMLPNSYKKDSCGSNSSVFDNIIVETMDLLESEEIIHLTESCISCGFSYVTDQLAEYFYSSNLHQNNGDNINLHPVPATSSTPDVLISAKPAYDLVNLNMATIPMAKIIPIVNGLMQSHSNKDDILHSWIQLLILMDSLKTMGANIYETFSNKV